jgi:hypothetical protein
MKQATNQREFYPKSDIERMFELKRSRGDGNCLFHSFAHVLKESLGIEESAASIRQNVCNLYRTLSRNSVRALSAIEEAIIMVLIPDSQNPDGKNHSKLVCRSGVYGTNIDVLAVSFLYKVHCSVWIPSWENKQQYYVQRYVNDTLAPGSPVVNILFDGTGHYDALFPKRHSASDSPGRTPYIPNPGRSRRLARRSRRVARRGQARQVKSNKKKAKRLEASETRRRNQALQASADRRFAKQLQASEIRRRDQALQASADGRLAKQLQASEIGHQVSADGRLAKQMQNDTNLGR